MRPPGRGPDHLHRPVAGSRSGVLRFCGQAAKEVKGAVSTSAASTSVTRWKSLIFRRFPLRDRYIWMGRALKGLVSMRLRLHERTATMAVEFSMSAMRRPQPEKDRASQVETLERPRVVGRRPDEQGVSDDFCRLRRAIKRLHGCHSTHVASVSVTDTFRGRTVWVGTVEVFSLRAPMREAMLRLVSFPGARLGQRGRGS